MTKKFLFVLAAMILMQLLGHKASADQTTVTGLARSYPFSGNLELQYKQDYLLWDQREDSKIKFGYFQPRFLVAAAGTIDGQLNLYPISILELSVGWGWTSRYYKLKKFECDLQVCDGTVLRNRAGARLLLGHEFDFGTAILIPGYQMIVSTHKDDSKPLADEQELNLTRNGGDEAQVSTIMAGVKRNDEVLGVVHRYSYMKHAKNSSEAQYLIYRFKMDELGYTVGLGQYKSDLNEKEFSAIFSVQWQTGESIGLF